MAKKGHAHRQRIGRKAMACGRMDVAIQSKIGNTPSPKSRRRMSFAPVTAFAKRHALPLAIVGAVLIAGFGGYKIFAYQQHLQAVEKHKAYEQERMAAHKRIVECEKRKAEAKPELIGKVTYDELYDYGACNE